MAVLIKESRNVSIVLNHLLTVCMPTEQSAEKTMERIKSSPGKNEIYINESLKRSNFKWYFLT